MDAQTQENISRSEYLELRGLRYHLRLWGPAEAPKLFLLHGLADVSDSYQLVVEALQDRWQVICPDWRGHGESEWNTTDAGYWWPDYVADLDAILEHYQPEAPVDLVGHSMGGQVASFYAGIRPERIGQLGLLDSLNIPTQAPETVVTRYQKWLQQIRKPPENKTYQSFEALAERVRHRNPRLDEQRALFVANCWGSRAEDGRIHLRADPKHRMWGPYPYRVEESLAAWAEVTAPTLCLDGAESHLIGGCGEEELGRRRAVFKDLRRVVIEDAGHMLHHEAPAEVTQQIEEFLSR